MKDPLGVFGGRAKRRKRRTGAYHYGHRAHWTGPWTVGRLRGKWDICIVCGRRRRPG